jgi:hypothetical protein
MYLYAEPLLGEALGVRTVSTQCQVGLSCLYSCSSLHPEHSNALALVADIIQQACNIYLLRARNRLNHSLSYELVENILVTQEGCPEGSPGEHVLIWAFFIAAAESSSEYHRTFFATKMRSYYHRLGFSNTIKALDLLGEIWNISDGSNWTSFQPKTHILIM